MNKPCLVIERADGSVERREVTVIQTHFGIEIKFEPVSIGVNDQAHFENVTMTID